MHGGTKNITTSEVSSKTFCCCLFGWERVNLSLFVLFATSQARNAGLALVELSWNIGQRLRKKSAKTEGEKRRWFPDEAGDAEDAEILVCMCIGDSWHWPIGTLLLLLLSKAETKKRSYSPEPTMLRVDQTVWIKRLIIHRGQWSKNKTHQAPI